jgi:hypothetical protein
MMMRMAAIRLAHDPVQPTGYPPAVHHNGRLPACPANVNTKEGVHRKPTRFLQGQNTSSCLRGVRMPTLNLLEVLAAVLQGREIPERHELISSMTAERVVLARAYQMHLLDVECRRTTQQGADIVALAHVIYDQMATRA